MGEAYNIFYLVEARTRGQGCCNSSTRMVADVIQSRDHGFRTRTIERNRVAYELLEHSSLRWDCVFNSESVSDPFFFWGGPSLLGGVISKKRLTARPGWWTYLLGGLKKEDIRTPGLFQATVCLE